MGTKTDEVAAIGSAATRFGVGDLWTMENIDDLIVDLEQARPNQVDGVACPLIIATRMSNYRYQPLN